MQHLQWYFCDRIEIILLNETLSFVVGGRFDMDSSMQVPKRRVNVEQNYGDHLRRHKRCCHVVSM
jgi:hypothetical protein